MCQLEKLKKNLYTIAEPVYDNLQQGYWISRHPDGDNGENYCLSCGEKELDKMKKTLSVEDADELILDGGYATSHDSIVTCSKCHTFLECNLTDSAIEQELSHYETCLSIQDPFIVINTPEAAYEFVEMLENIWEPEQTLQRDRLLPLVRFGKHEQKEGDCEKA